MTVMSSRIPTKMLNKLTKRLKRLNYLKSQKLSTNRNTKMHSSPTHSPATQTYSYGYAFSFALHLKFNKKSPIIATLHEHTYDDKSFFFRIYSYL